MKQYVIIGNGVAGSSAAERIKKADAKAKVTIFTEEPDPFYYRPRLPEYMAGEATLEAITLRNSAWYASQGIDLHLSCPVTQVDPEARTVTTGQGNKLNYDALLLATGGRAFMPPVTGAEKAGVCALRTAGDARLIAQAARKTEKAVLMGGGLLGLEAGAALARMGLKVRVVEMFDRLLPRQMDAAGAVKLQKILENMGFSFFLGIKAKEITGDKKADGVTLEDGAHLEGGLVLFSAGVRGNLDLARHMGLKMDKGLSVDDRLRTSRDGIWAAGDHIEHRGRLYGIWPASKAQGEAAGINMAGGDALYEGTVPSNSLKVVGVDLTSAGNIDPEGKLEAVVYEDDKAYRKIVLEGGKIKGFIFFGLTDGVKECQKALAQELNVSAFVKDMRQRDFAFAKLPSTT